MTHSNDLRRWISLCEGSQRLDDNFRAWFGESKVVDAAGDPLVVYHGTSHRFDAFDLSKSREGFFFTNSRGRAEIYGGHVIAAYLSIQNPAPFKAYVAWAGRGWVRAREEMERLGYDGLITRDNDTTYLAFSPQQIKIIEDPDMRSIHHDMMTTKTAE